MEGKKKEIAEQELYKKKMKEEARDGEASDRTAILCKDKKCPFHGKLSLRGRSFEGYVTMLREKRAVVEFKRFIFVRKYERYEVRKTRIHAHLPDCLAERIRIGSYVSVTECRPLSKMIHHVVTGLVKET
jgi:small subunit ribosomal protein S17